MIIPTPEPKVVLSLDIGEKRIGVATANSVSRLPSPLTTIEGSDKALQSVLELIQDLNASALVVGLPRGLKGQETPQTGVIREFIELLQNSAPAEVYLQDEAVTSKQAEEELQRKGMRYTKEQVDALAATYILEDFLRDNPNF